MVDGLKSFPEAIAAVFLRTQIQTCIVHLKTRGHFPNDEAATKLIYLASQFQFRYEPEHKDL